MKVKNISEKIIGFGSHILLPDEEVDFTQDEISLYSVDSFVNLGLVSIDGKGENKQVEYTKEAFDAAVMEAAKKLVAEQQAAQAELEISTDRPIVDSENKAVSEDEAAAAPDSPAEVVISTPKRTRKAKS